MTTTLDWLYVALIAVASLADHFGVWRGFVRRSATNPGPARRWLWSAWIILLWALVAAGAALWVLKARAWASVGFTVPHGWRLWVAIGLVGVYAAQTARTAVKIQRSRAKVKFAHASGAMLAPRTGPELGHWIALSLTAGFCEEFIYRGYLIWAFQSLLGLWGAAAFSLLAFTLVHSYQGAKGLLRVAIAGGWLTLVVLILGSLWPAIALHALVDSAHGLIGWLALRRSEGAAPSVPSPAGALA